MKTRSRQARAVWRKRDGVIPVTARNTREASCYTCHAKNGAVENIPVARAKGTVRADFIGMPPTLGELFQRVSAEGWPAGEHLLSEAATRWPGARVLQEGTLNQLGYRLLQAGKKPAALAVFEHVTQQYPASANAWDSLSEAYEGAGNLEGARARRLRAHRGAGWHPAHHLRIGVRPHPARASRQGLRGERGRLGASAEARGEVSSVA